MMEQHPIIAPKKLIEVALPLDAINEAAAREKSIRHGHPSTLHLWWARRPLAAARAVIFAQMVNDPSWKWELENPEELPPGNLKASWTSSRNRLFAIIKNLVMWENTANEAVLERARKEIRKSWRDTCEINKDHPMAEKLFDPDNLPYFHDPFAGGGALPLEAQRLGLEAHASDLNPVAVLINKAMIEIPPMFANMPPVNPEVQNRKDSWCQQWIGAHGLSEDVRYYGKWMLKEAKKRIGNLYPSVQVTRKMAKNRPDLKPYAGQKLTVIAWIWARTVPSPNPAYSEKMVPLVSSFIISSKKNNETWIETNVDRENKTIDYRIRRGGTDSELLKANKGTTAGKRSGFRCIFSDVAMPYEHIRQAGRDGKMGQTLIAIVAGGDCNRVYLGPCPEHLCIAHSASPDWVPDTSLPENPRNFNTPNYGLTTFGDLFTERQLAALTTFTNLLSEVKEKIQNDACNAGMKTDNIGLAENGKEALAYAESIAVYLSFAITKMADRGSTICSWDSKRSSLRNTFAKQAVPMTWDFAEGNPFSGSTGSWKSCINWIWKVIECYTPSNTGLAFQQDAQKVNCSDGAVISTDPPYYDNIIYADLSDFFYIWLRRAQKSIFPKLFATLSTPKADELVVTPYRRGDKEQAKAFFLQGMTKAMQNLWNMTHPAFPVTIYYAFKQSETNTETGTVSHGWETFLDAVLQAGFSLTGTWPMRTEMKKRQIAMGANALASSIVLVCRRRSPDAKVISRRDFIRELNKTLPDALEKITRGAGDGHSPVAPVDLSQAIIGPGMAVFSKYAAVLEADGSKMSVRTALELINRFLAEGDFDNETQFCLHWFEQNGWKDGMFDEAHTLARAMGTNVDGVKQSNVISATGGIVRLLRWAEYPSNWDACEADYPPVWKALHHLIRVFKTEGESGAGKALATSSTKTEAARQLAYRLYTLCERAGLAEDARAYDEIVKSWNAIEHAASAMSTPKQSEMFN